MQSNCCLGEQFVSVAMIDIAALLLRSVVGFLFVIKWRFRFQTRAKQSSVPLAPIQLIHGNFLEHTAVRDAMSTAGLVYINNPRFGPTLNMNILCTLMPLMKKGCQLVCFDDCGLDQWDALQFVKKIHVPRGANIDSLC